MSIEVVLEGALEKEKDREQFSQYLKDVCEKKKVHIEDYDTTLMMDICPEGYIECSYEGTFVSIAAQTNVAGPGFHAFVCSFFDEIIMNSPISFEISDPTKYYEERNFENLKYKYFYQWLKEIAGYVKEHHQELNNLLISWPMDYYQPIGKDGYVVTPMGYISVEDFTNLDTEELAERFFIWNDLDFHAGYYRNCAISLLWKECFFEYSSMNEYTDKMANMIIDYIEAAYEKDDTIPLPMKEYHALCEAIKREDIIHHGIDMNLTDIGYRRYMVSYPFGNWRIPVPGCSENGYDEKTQTLHFMAPYKHNEDGWKWLIKANAYVFEEELSFAEAFLCEEAFDIENQNFKGKGLIEETEEYYRISTQYISGKETMLVECIIRNQEDIDTLREWAMMVEHTKVNEEDEKKN